MSFDISRLRRADQIIAGGAIALFIFMFFFKWYGVSSNVPSIAGVNVNVSRSGWDTFTNSRWIWLITIIIALLVVAAAGLQRHVESPVQPSVLVAGLGALSTLLIIYRILHHPSASASIGSFHASAGIKIGIWLGLIAAAAITYGGYLAMQSEGTSIADVRDQASSAFSGIAGATAGGEAKPPSPPASSGPPIPPPAAPAPPESPGEPPASA
jgi:hypothetical protein